MGKILLSILVIGVLVSCFRQEATVALRQVVFKLSAYIYSINNRELTHEWVDNLVINKVVFGTTDNFAISMPAWGSSIMCNYTADVELQAISVIIGEANKEISTQTSLKRCRANNPFKRLGSLGESTLGVVANSNVSGSVTTSVSLIAEFAKANKGKLCYAIDNKGANSIRNSLDNAPSDWYNIGIPISATRGTAIATSAKMVLSADSQYAFCPDQITGLKAYSDTEILENSDNSKVSLALVSNDETIRENRVETNQSHFSESPNLQSEYDAKSLIQILKSATFSSNHLALIGSKPGGVAIGCNLHKLSMFA